MPRTIAIGDIHGCDLALEAILNAIGPTAEDVIITLGDVVDRGANSRRVVELLLDLAQRCQHVGIMGNHEEMMLKVVAGREPPACRSGASASAHSRTSRRTRTRARSRPMSRSPVPPGATRSVSSI